MDFEEQESATGWRPVYNYPPATKDFAHGAVIPFGVFYSPFMAYPE